MYDASGNESLDIKVELAQNSTGYTLTLTPNQQWLNSEDRAYPVTLDPPISTSLVGSTSISDAHVSETYPTSNFGNSYMLKTGVGRHRTYVKFILPTLQSGDMVYAAYFKANLLTSNPDYRQINVHRVNSTWEESTITWGDLISYNTKIEDYQMVKDINVEYAWNITAIAKDWYNTGINNGLMLKNNDETVGYCEFVSSNTSSAYENARPQVTIYYTNNSGLEDYWTYHSQSVGRAGTGYVNDYNGNLVFVHSDLEMNGNRMPVSISHVYNSNDKDTDIYFGKGWRLNLSQSIKYQNIEGIEYYIYTDEDGTKHYLKSDGTGKYKDESGLNIALTSNADGTYTIKDKKDNELIFASFAKLKSIKDNNGNVLTLNYNSSNVLESAIDGVGRKTTFELTPAGHLIGIIDPSGNRTSFSYTGVQLTDIGYPDGKHTIFNYDSSNKLKSAVNFDGYKMGYEYCSGQPYRVQDIQEYGADGSLGQTLNLKYGYNTTTFTDKSNRKNIYQFNTLGNTMSIRDDDESAEYYKYFTDDNAAKNKLESTSRLQKTVMNYLNNHNIETSTDWVGGNWTGSTGSYSISASQSYLGNQSLMVSKTNSISRHFYGQTVYLEKGKTYTFSGYVKTDTSGISSTNKKGAALFVNYQNSSGVWQTVESSYVNGIKGWDRYEVTFTVPSDASSTMVYLRAGVIEETGTAYFDCLQLEDGKIANRYNIVENADFKNGLTGWTKNTFTDSNDILATVGGAPGIDANTFKLTGNATKSKNFYQIINMAGKANDVFSIGGWAKGHSVSTPGGSGRYFALDIGLRKTGTSTYQYKVVYFNEDSTDWQYASEMIKADYDYDSIIVYGLYYNNANYAYFDGIQLYKEEFSDSYTVNTTTGNLESTNSVAERNSTFNYNAKNELTSYVDPKGSTFTYDYKNSGGTETHNLYKATTAENVVYSFDYDAYGNPIKASVGTAASVIFTATAAYSDGAAATETESAIDKGNYIKSVTDYDGNTINYNFNEKRGTLDSVTDAKGNTTSYSYDNLDRLTGAESQGVTNSYTYENDRLQKITHNGFSYVFDYDKFGRVTTVGVDGQAKNLITNTYDINTGNLTKSIYGNDDAVGIEYDNLDRIKAQKYGKASDTVLNDRYRFDYDVSGNLGYEEDLENGINYRYTYDLADRLTKIVDSNKNTTTYSFDKNSNVSNFSETVNGQNYSVGYTYDKDNKIDVITLGENNTINHDYDSIGRLKSVTVTIGSTTFTTSYNYSDVNGVNKAKLQKLILPNGREISYTYDKNNNIESIKEGNKVVKYRYNGLNQLIREDNGFLGTAGKTITYSYDVGGNILSKTEYPLTEDDNLPAVVKTYEYKYDKTVDGGTGWNDKLVKIIVTENGTPITYDMSYDKIGNLTSYNGYSYTWEGRQLRSITGNEKNISFKYNSSGIRTEKTVDGKVTKYHLVGDRVTYEETKDSSGNVINKIYYIYSSTGKLVAMKLDDVQYNYIRNAQGDIIGLLDSTGAEVVSYMYDSWGKLEAIGGTKASTVGVVNPYRYRGYRYDAESGLYYLQNRYYNSEWGRFINADALVGQTGELLSHNIFAYCRNNPINMSDKNGFRPAFDSEEEEDGYYTWKEQKKSGNAKPAPPPDTNLLGTIWGTTSGVVGNIKKGVNAYVGSDSVMHFYPSTSIAQKIQPYAKGANIAAKAFTVVTTGFDIAYTWDPHVQLSLGQRFGKTALQLLGVGVGIAVGTFLSGPLLAAGMASGGFALFGGVAGALVIDYAAGSLVSIGQECIYKKYGLE